IDIQNEYFENGALPLVNPETESLNARKVLDHFRANNLPIAHIQHASPFSAVSSRIIVLAASGIVLYPFADRAFNKVVFPAPGPPVITNKFFIIFQTYNVLLLYLLFL